VAIGLPEGFQLDQPQSTAQPVNSGLPEGFQLNQTAAQDPQISRSQAAFTTMTNPLGFGDEIKAGIAAMTAKILGGKATKDIDIGDLYNEARTNERTKLEQARTQYPIQ